MLKLLLYYNTLRHLKPIQIYYRICYFARNKIIKPKLTHPSGKNLYSYSFLKFIQGIAPLESYYNGSFSFLNQTAKHFSLLTGEGDQGVKQDWNFPDFGKLWTYNLNYFDYLQQPSLTREKGIELIHNFIHQSESHTTGLDPYPTSLRIINWIKFISRHSINDPLIIESLHDQCKLLLKNIEYHLLGNHILENGFALFSAGLFYNETGFYEKGRQILVTQLNEQILDDGGHFELSPMYHAIILNRLLDLINILQNNPGTDQELLPFIQEKASRMILWISEMTFSSGDIPLFNDAARNIAPDTKQLLDYADRLDITSKSENYKLSASGYRKYASNCFEMIIDAGIVGPRYIPGHAHADMLNFELYINGKPYIVDTGTSTYLQGAIRSYERSTSAHNSVTIGSTDQSEMWGSHRVARMAECLILSDDPKELWATVTGFPPLNATHRRTLRFQEDHIEIEDVISNTKNLKGFAYFHFSPGVRVDLIDNHATTSYGTLYFESADSIEVGEFNYAPEFNKTIPATLLKVCFSRSLKTKILLNN